MKSLLFCIFAMGKNTDIVLIIFASKAFVKSFFAIFFIKRHIFRKVLIKRKTKGIPWALCDPAECPVCPKRLSGFSPQKSPVLQTSLMLNTIIKQRNKCNKRNTSYYGIWNMCIKNVQYMLTQNRISMQSF